VPHASAPPPRRAGALRLAATAMLGAAWPGARPDTSGYAAADPASRFLLWAVTGAGKTEMLFPLIESALRRGGRVLVATPRRDVVLELAPRLRRAFPHEPLTVLYGGSEERWHRGVITLATTHQLLRFARAFDLVVIDELDAFPFHGDPMLSYAAEICRADGGRTVYLSATPPRGMLALVRRGRLACAKVPVRYHRHPLPVPELLRMLPLAECLRRGRLPDALLRRCGQSLRRGAQLFVFVPKIAYAERLAALLRRAFPGVAVGATSSQDGERGDKVLSFRSAEVRILVTTTILERGVTVPRSDVYILDADSRLFDEASLVQMAGRAGRSAEDPSGCVVFASAQHTAAQAGACRQIRRMNGWAKPFLLTAPGGDSSPVHSPEGPKR
ncbi:helicase-related protein, partial [Saccharibacillus sp. WB 17]